MEPKTMVELHTFLASYWWTVTTYRYFEQQQFAVCPLWMFFFSWYVLPGACTLFLDLWSEFEGPSFLVLRLCQGSWWLRLFAYRRMDGKTSQYVLVYIFGIPSCRGYDCLVFPSRLRFVVQTLRQRWKQFTTGWKNLTLRIQLFLFSPRR